LVVASELHGEVAHDQCRAVLKRSSWTGNWPYLENGPAADIMTGDDLIFMTQLILRLRRTDDEIAHAHKL